MSSDALFASPRCVGTAAGHLRWLVTVLTCSDGVPLGWCELRLDDAVRDGRRTTGRRTLGKSDILRALVAQLGEDTALRQAVPGRLE
jgi:hypothetical protein